VALKATCIKNVELKIVERRTAKPLRKPKLGGTKPSTGPHAAHGLDIAGLVHCTNNETAIEIFPNQKKWRYIVHGLKQQLWSIGNYPFQV